MHILTVLKATLCCVALIISLGSFLLKPSCLIFSCKSFSTVPSALVIAGKNDNLKSGYVSRRLCIKRSYISSFAAAFFCYIYVCWTTEVDDLTILVLYFADYQIRSIISYFYSSFSSNVSSIFSSIALINNHSALHFGYFLFLLAPYRYLTMTSCRMSR